jgi:hypothetical protein
MTETGAGARYRRVPALAPPHCDVVLALDSIAWEVAGVTG